MKALKIIGISLGVIVGVVIVGLVALGSAVPETYIYPGHQVPKKYVKEIRDLGLLEDEEKIVYFYTDALFDIKDGFYFVSDKHLVLYSKEWEEPETIIDFVDIGRIDVEYDTSFFTDSYVTVETYSGWEVSFPLSSEKGRDKKFVEYIKSRMVIRKDVEDDAEAAAEDLAEGES